MSILTYKIVFELPVPGPNGDPPFRTEVMAHNEATGQQVELTEDDANRLRVFSELAIARGRPVV